MINLWGFVTSECQIRELFDWLDYDKDGKLGYEDLRETIGLDVSPKQEAYFRQNMAELSKNRPC